MRDGLCSRALEYSCKQLIFSFFPPFLPDLLLECTSSKPCVLHDVDPNCSLHVAV